MIDKDNIIALATPAGSGAISIIRISGSKSIEISKIVKTNIPSLRFIECYQKVK